VARKVFDEAKEAAKRVSKEAAKEAAMSSTSIVKGDVICCGRANCQGTQKYTGASWTHQFGHKTKGVICNTCGKKTVASKWAVVAA
jgi:hypothetical protein